MATVDNKSYSRTLLRQHRIKRLTAEVRLLHLMDERLWRLGWICFWATFAAVVGLTYGIVELVGRSSDVTSSFHIVAFIASLLGAAFLYWFWRYPTWGFALLGYLVLILCLAALFDDGYVPHIPDTGWPSDSGYSAPTDRKERLRWRVQRAIQKRQKLLEKLKA